MLRLTQHSADQPSAPPVRPPRAELIARVRNLLPGVLKESDRFRTALIFLASHWTPSVDRLARFAGCERELVARYARRWADHGLWGRSVAEADALDPSEIVHALEVAEGLVRRPDHHSGVEADDPFAIPLGVGEALDWTSSGDLAPVNQAGEGGADTLLTALWHRLGLASPAAVADRRAA